MKLEDLEKRLGALEKRLEWAVDLRKMDVQLYHGLRDSIYDCVEMVDGMKTHLQTETGFNPRKMGIKKNRGKSEKEGIE